MLARMSSPSRKRTGIILGVSTAIVAGAFGGALYMAFTFSGAASPSQPQQVTVHQAAATAQPTATVTVTKAATVHKKAATKKATTKARTLVSTNQGAQAAAADPATADPEPLNGGGQDPNPDRPTSMPTLPGRGPAH